MDLRRLRYFLAAAESENFSRAADRMNIARPALSRHIQQLEAELGVLLFERQGRRVRLSRAGRLYARQVGDALNILDRARDDARQFARPDAQIIRIGLLDLAGLQERVVDALRTLRTLFPVIEIILTPLSSPDQIAALERGAIDAGFIYDWPGSGPDLAHVNVAIDTWMLAVPPQHAFAGQASVSLKSLAAENFVSIAPGIAPRQHEQLLAACRRGGLSPNIIQYVPTPNALHALVATGVGVAFVTRLTRPPATTLVPILDMNLDLPFDFVWRRNEERPLIRAAVEAIAGSVQEH